MEDPPVFHRLCIAEINRETSEAVAVTFAVPPSWRPVSDTYPAST